MILHDLFDWTSSGVGLTGLALTVGALWQATGAKRAATEAREAVYQRNAADALAEMVRLAEDCEQYLLLERPNEAALRARDIVSRIPKERKRFERFLIADSDKLKALEIVFQELVGQLSLVRSLEDKANARSTGDAIGRAKAELSSVHGRLLSRVDEEDS
ncbi:MAG TPA: hypothetical protein VMU71_06585 [Terracidiphilus sp.]|nr:hypothetical protein [Terracidiphilus sp.]